MAEQQRAGYLAGDAEPLPDLPHDPGGVYCGVGTGPPKPGHPEYRRCHCGQWYGWSGSWQSIQHPPRRWLKRHGLDAGELLDYGGKVDGGFLRSRPPLRLRIRWLLERIRNG
jgi:hypothetical protein